MRRLSYWFMGGLAVLPLAALAWILTTPLRTELHPALYSALAGGVAIACHRALMFAESRGWIYYRKRRGSYGGLGVTSEWLNMYDPSRKHLQAATRIQEWKREEDDDGDGDGKGTVPPGVTRPGRQGSTATASISTLKAGFASC